MELLARMKERNPEYDSRFHDMIMQFTMSQGGRLGTATEADSFEEGKFFTRRYEIYMYAALLGIKKDYRVDIQKGAEKRKFIEIKSWNPTDVADYIVMCLFALSDIDFLEFENLEEDQVEKKLTELKKMLEEYANGGFDMIHSKLLDDPTFFSENENCFIDLLD